MSLGDLVQIMGPADLNPCGVGIITSSEPMTRMGSNKMHLYYEVMIADDVVVVCEDYLKIIEKLDIS